MCENGTGHEESRGPTRWCDSAARRFRIFLSVSETWNVEECHCGRDESGLTSKKSPVVEALCRLVRRPSPLVCRGVVIWTQRLVPSRCEW